MRAVSIWCASQLGQTRDSQQSASRREQRGRFASRKISQTAQGGTRAAVSAACFGSRCSIGIRRNPPWRLRAAWHGRQSSGTERRDRHCGGDRSARSAALRPETSRSQAAMPCAQAPPGQTPAGKCRAPMEMPCAQAREPCAQAGLPRVPPRRPPRPSRTPIATLFTPIASRKALRASTRALRPARYASRAGRICPARKPPASRHGTFCFARKPEPLARKPETPARKLDTLARAPGRRARPCGGRFATGPVDPEPGLRSAGIDHAADLHFSADPVASAAPGAGHPRVCPT